MPGTYTATVTATDPEGASGTSSTAPFQIVNPTITAAITKQNTAEAGDTPATISFSRNSGTTTTAQNVAYTIGGTATNGVDYTSLSGNLTIPIGQSSQSLSVTAVLDQEIEDTETVLITMLAGSDYVVGTPGTLTLNIADVPVVGISAVSSYAIEPATSGGAATNGVFRIWRSGVLANSLSVNVTLAGSSATSGSDYTAIASPIVIPAGQAFVDVQVAPLYDTTLDDNETVVMSIAAGTQTYQIDQANSATITIIDANSKPTVSIVATKPNASEAGPVNGTFTVSRAGLTTNSLNVSLTVTGTATNGSDYIALPATITIPAGAVSTSVDVTPVDDTLVESTETVISTIAANAAYTVGLNASATVTIEDNDPAAVMPALTPAGGSFSRPVTVTATCSTPGAIIHYTFTGQEPTESDPWVTSTRTILVPGTRQLKAKVWAPGVGPGNTVSGNYRVVGSAAMGYLHSLRLHGDGTLVATGLNETGRLGDGTTTNRSAFVSVVDSTGNPLQGMAAVAAGYDHSVALSDDGFIWTGAGTLWANSATAH